MSIKTKLTSMLKKSLDKLNIELENDIVIEKPAKKENGDYSTNIALTLTKKLHQSPMEIATNIKENLEKEDVIEDIQIASPGFINIYLKKEFLLSYINKIIKENKNYGKNNIGNNKKINIEFVSANPTGILHIGHGRGATYGDNLARIMNFSGYDVTKEYVTGEVRVLALNNTSFEINKGELVVILGPYGAGKTTALNILGGMDNATSGKVIIANKDITKYSKKELIKYRRSDIGFVFQFYNLIQNLTTLENVELATEICKRPLPPREILEKVGLKDRLNNFPSQLSGGEQQRVSIARAIAKNPKILLCDEPTGALDYNTGKQILKLLQDTARKDKMTVIIITHNAAIAPMADKVIKFKNGTVEGVVLNDNPTPVERIEW